MIACVSCLLVCQIQMGGLWSSLGLRETRQGGQRLIVHKSSRSIVSGEPPAARAGVVPMDRRPTCPSRPVPSRLLRFHPVSPSGWEAARRGEARLLLGPLTRHVITIGAQDKHSLGRTDRCWLCGETEDGGLCFGLNVNTQENSSRIWRLSISGRFTVQFHAGLLRKGGVVFRMRVQLPPLNS